MNSQAATTLTSTGIEQEPESCGAGGPSSSQRASRHARDELNSLPVTEHRGPCTLPRSGPPRLSFRPTNPNPGHRQPQVPERLIDHSQRKSTAANIERAWSRATTGKRDGEG